MVARSGWCIALLIAGAISGCGSDDDGDDGTAVTTPTTTAESKPSPKPTSSLRFVAAPTAQHRWTKKSYRAKGGTVEIRLANPSDAPHNVAIEKSKKCCEQRGHKWLTTSPTIEKGETTKVVVDLKPGRYWAYCNIASHWQGGMVSRLVVD
jgi:plastocyanin